MTVYRPCECHPTTTFGVPSIFKLTFTGVVNDSCSTCTELNTDTFVAEQNSPCDWQFSLSTTGCSLGDAHLEQRVDEIVLILDEFGSNPVTWKRDTPFKGEPVLVLDYDSGSISECDFTNSKAYLTPAPLSTTDIKDFEEVDCFFRMGGTCAQLASMWDNLGNKPSTGPILGCCKPNYMFAPVGCEEGGKGCERSCETIEPPKVMQYARPECNLHATDISCPQDTFRIGSCTETTCDVLDNSACPTIERGNQDRRGALNCAGPNCSRIPCQIKRVLNFGLLRVFCRIVETFGEAEHEKAERSIERSDAFG